MWFQSTPPHGGRQGTGKVTDNVYEVSIHAPAWGATVLTGLETTAAGGFNPRPRMGGDCFCLTY